MKCRDCSPSPGVHRSRPGRGDIVETVAGGLRPQTRGSLGGDPTPSSSVEPKIDRTPSLVTNPTEHPLAARSARGQEVVAREEHRIVLVGEHAVPARQNQVDERHEVSLRDDAGQHVAQDLVVDGRKVLHDIGAQDEAMSARKRMQAIERRVGALANTIGKAARHEQALESRLDDRAECVMDNAIAERGGADPSSLRLADQEVDVRARAIRPCFELLSQLQQLVGDRMAAAIIVTNRVCRSRPRASCSATCVTSSSN